jgi:hypothetical protein
MKKSKVESPAKTPALMRRYIYYRDAVDAVKRLRFTPNGNRYVVRFPLGQRVEHFILILSFTTLAITGLAQTYSGIWAALFFLYLAALILRGRSIMLPPSFLAFSHFITLSSLLMMPLFTAALEKCCLPGAM